MAMTDGPQDIPSAFLQDAQDLGIPVRSDGRVQANPWHQYLGPFSESQWLTWQTFWRATKIWWMQPWFDGVTPPAIGPRTRSWWYDVGQGFSVGYYNYFMYLTLLLLYIDFLPEWAQEWITKDSFVDSYYSNAIRGGWEHFQVGVWTGDDKFSLQRIYLKTPGWYPKTLYLYTGILVSGMAQRGIDIYNVDPDAWTEDTLKWNNQPAWGSLITTVQPPFISGTWLKVDIGKAESVMIRLVDESIPWDPNVYFMLSFNSHEYEEIWKRPYQGMTI